MTGFQSKVAAVSPLFLAVFMVACSPIAPSVSKFTSKSSSLLKSDQSQNTDSSQHSSDQMTTTFESNNFNFVDASEFSEVVTSSAKQKLTNTQIRDLLQDSRVIFTSSMPLSETTAAALSGKHLKTHVGTGLDLSGAQRDLITSHLRISVTVEHTSSTTRSMKVALVFDSEGAVKNEILTILDESADYLMIEFY